MLTVVRPAALALGGIASFVMMAACTTSSASRATSTPRATPTAASSSRPAVAKQQTTAGQQAGASSAGGPADSPASTGAVPDETATSTSVRSADPADYHVGSDGPSDPVRRDLQTVSFRSPSHNVSCTILSKDDVVCEIDEHTFPAAARPDTCTLNWLGSDVTLGTGGAVLGVCAGNPVVMEDSTVLPYGYRLTSGAVSCTSSRSAIRCDSGRHGFALSRAAATLH